MKKTASISSPENAKTEKKYPFWFYLIAVLIPFIFFALIETLLRIADYGEDLEVWVPVSEHFPDYICLNDKIASRYFSTIKTLPTPWPDGFRKEKKKGSYRLFVMGESSAAGFPYDLNGSFANEIERRLTFLYPETEIEVVNVAMAAINSYTLLDLTPEIIRQQPDAVIIYTGHNEFYGALGVGSTEQIGSVRWLVNLMLKLERFRTVQLIRDGLAWIYSVGITEEDSAGTLMERMVGNQLIPEGSDLMNAGISQFEGNMSGILGQFRDENIPVMLMTLTSNLRDQKPFIPDTTKTPNAQTYFDDATGLVKSDSITAYQKFVDAKEADLLKFRAPESFNSILLELGERFNYPVIRIDSLYRTVSRYGIPGDELMTDHLHPTWQGYRAMGKWMTDELLQTEWRPGGRQLIIRPTLLDSISNRLFPLTRFDVLAAEFKIAKLKNGWPFVKTTEVESLHMNPTDTTDAENIFAARYANREFGWEDAHVRLGEVYRKQKNIAGFLAHMDALMAFAPYNDSPPQLAAETLIGWQRPDLAVPYLNRLEILNPTDFSAKWLGTYYLAVNDYTKAVEFLQKSYDRNRFDTQMLYNLAGALVFTKNDKQALHIIRQCLEQKPDFPGAKEFEQSLVQKMQVGDKRIPNRKPKVFKPGSGSGKR